MLAQEWALDQLADAEDLPHCCALGSPLSVEHQESELLDVRLLQSGPQLSTSLLQLLPVDAQDPAHTAAWPFTGGQYCHHLTC